MRVRHPLIHTAFVVALLSSSPGRAAKCDTDAVPAATLLFPYFQLDLEQPNGRTTLFAISNAAREPVLASVVLWTDWAIPTLQFNVYLSGHDVQTINLRDVFVHGRLPATGSAVSNHGDLSGLPGSFPGCNNTIQPGLAPVYSDPALTSAKRGELAALHTGKCHGGVRASLDAYDDNVARGYITVDVVRQCSPLTPADAGYFGAEGIVGHGNVLNGDYFLVEADENFAQGELAVHIEAFPGEFSSGDYTFYRRYVDSSAVDFREPLGSQYAFRHLTGGGFDGGTQVIVWRDTGSRVATPVSCQGFPEWWGPDGALPGYRVYFDEAGNADPDLDTCASPFVCAYPMGGATQLVGMTLSAFPEFFPEFPIGRTYLTTRRASAGVPSEQWGVLQGWVAVTNSAEGRFSVGQRAARLDSACDPLPIDPAPEDFESSSGGILDANGLLLKAGWVQK